MGLWVDFGKEIHLVKRFISLLLISICLGDILILKDKSVYKGALIYYGNDEIIFKPLPQSAKLSVNIKDIKELKLSDGTTVFENGTLKGSEEKIRQYIEMVILNHSQNHIGEIMNIFAVLFCIFVAYRALLEINLHPNGFSLNYTS